MIAKLIAWCIDNRFLVLTISVILVVVSAWALYTISIGAMPDLSDVQVILYAPWQGRDPQTIEDQVTYPLTTTMLSVPGVSDVFVCCDACVDTVKENPDEHLAKLKKR